MRDAVSPERARSWLDRWDRQQEYYMVEREQRFAIMAEVLAAGFERPDPVVVDLGIGPGSLAARLLEQFPQLQIVGVDADPLLIDLAESAYGSAGSFGPDRLRIVDADLRSDGWYDELGLDRAPDAYVSTTALHWMNREPLRQMIATCGRTIAPGGVFLDGDHLYEGAGGERLDALLRLLTAQRLERDRPEDAEDWRAWWAAVEADPELADQVAERAGGFDHVITDRPSVYDYLDFLREAGFTEAGIIWQYADDRVIAGLAPKLS